MQLVCLARAALKKVPVLCLDEATAAMDPHTEAYVLEIIERLFSDRTTFTIAHRWGLGWADAQGWWGGSGCDACKPSPAHRPAPNQPRALHQRPQPGRLAAALQPSLTAPSHALPPGLAAPPAGWTL